MPKLLVDSTAARLSKWLRFLGLDAALDRSKSTAGLLVRARREGRVLVSRRRSLESGSAPGSPPGVVLLESDHLVDQLRQVIATLKLSEGFSPRCTICNGELDIVPRVNADGRVPEFVYRTQSEFAFCHNCDKYYWKGSHWKNVHDASRPLLSE
ncbi:MAG: hypothetical protein NTX17_04500 [Candidatus Eisenbacteria bacterium]|nr:hypothetical protein [Candidatus Eisenbacteria bacterium]